MNKLRYVSLFSGIEAVSCAWHDLPMEPVAFSEVEKFPCNVLAHHFPNVPNLGDITKISPEQLSALGKVDLIVGGSPCQGFSLAGYQKGLDDVRSKLAINYVGIIRTVQPKWILWENVPGVCNTNGGADFKYFVKEIADLGYCLAWRLLDAQYFGVPQRRRRIFLVGYRGDGFGPAQVLFERKGLSGNTTQGEGKGCCSTSGLNNNTRDTKSDVCLDIAHRSDVVRMYKSVTPTLTARMGTGGNNTPLVYAFAGYSSFTKTRVAAPLIASGGSLGGGGENIIATSATGDRDAVASSIPRLRRLTPVECLRLQGFPDDWFTGVEGYSDTAAYKAIGNSMAVPVMRWIGQRICNVELGNDA